MKTHWRLAKNATANLIRGGAAGVVALFLPAVLVRHMTQIDYSVWVLVLQVAAYSSYLEFGLQTAVGRYIAVSTEKGDTGQRDSVYSTALTGLAIAAAIAIILLAAVILLAGVIFPTVPPALLTQMRWALLIVGASLALGLPSAAWSGVFIGLQRNELIAAVTVGAKTISALGLVLAVLHRASLVGMATVVAAVNLASYLLLYLLLRRFSQVGFHPRLVSKTAARELFNYCFSLMIWSFSTLLVTGLDLILVGRFELKALAPYAVATTLVTFIAGVQTAICGAMMPHAAVLHAREDSSALGAMVISSTRLGVLLLMLTGMPLLIYAGPLLRVWVGQQYALQGHLLLAVLLIANMIRLTGLPYSTVLVASGQQRLVTISPLMEGVANLIASVLLGLKFGAAGVAAGTLIGAIVGITGHVLYNMPRTRFAVVLRIRSFIVSGIALPVAASAPLVLLALYAWKRSSPTPLNFAGVFAISLLLSAGLLWSARKAKMKIVRLNAA